MSGDRCRYTHDVSPFPDVGEACCWRRVWEDTDRCVWHADESNKPLEAFGFDPGERLDGTIVRRCVVSDLDGLSECTLIEADFTRADVRGADFTGSDLREATFRGANAREATFERANVESVEFRDADLRGAYLDQAKMDEVDFTGSRISRATTFGEYSIYELQLEETSDSRERRELFESATWTYRVLRRLAHQNARRGQAHDYLQREKNLRRRFAWADGYYPSAMKAELSRLVMGYGHNPWRVLVVSSLLIVVCAVLYPVTGGVQEVGAERTITYTVADPVDAPNWWVGRVFLKSLYFSIVTFATLGYGDFQPVGVWARALAGVEALLGGLLMALLVVVLSRRIWLQ